MTPLDALVPPVPPATRTRCTTEMWRLSCGCVGVPRGVAMAASGDPTWCDTHGPQVRAEIVSPAKPYPGPCVRCGAYWHADCASAPLECDHAGCAGKTYTIPDGLAVTLEGFTLCPEHGLVVAAGVLREVLQRGVSRAWLAANARRIDEALLVVDMLRERIVARREGRA